MPSLYRALVASMIGGRIVWGLATIVIIGVAGETFTWGRFVIGALLNAIPGIVILLGGHGGTELYGLSTFYTIQRKEYTGSDRSRKADEYLKN